MKSTFTLLVAVTCFVICSTTLAQDTAEKPAGKQAWVFLTTGPKKVELTKEESQQMMEQHLGNFKELAAAGDLVAAGPLADPTRKLRGIVLLNTGDLAKLNEFFTKDPFVKQEIMKLDGSLVDFKLGKFHTEINSEDLAQFQLVIFSAAEKGVNEGKNSEDLLSHTMTYLKNHKDQSAIKAFGVMSGGESKRTAILITKLDDNTAIEKIASDMPFVQAQLWTFETLPLYMSSGVFGK
jgi:uncharacterized protein YciI